MKMLKSYTLFGLMAAALCFLGCGKKENTEVKPAAVHYTDGTYKAVSSIKDDWGGSAEITVTIKDGKIIACEFLSYEKDGSLKGEDYGKVDGVIKNAGLYKIAQAAIEKAGQYGTRLLETQRLDKVDALAGATVSYKLFQNAAQLALEQAAKEVR